MQLQRWNGSLSDWNKALDDIRTFARERPAIAEQHLSAYFGLASAFIVSADVEPKEGGRIQINTICPAAYPWEGRYSPDIPITLTAKPKPGYSFSGWKELPNQKSATIDIEASSDISVTALFETDETHGQDKDDTNQKPAQFILEQNYPNPFNASTRISYSLPKSCDVTLTVYSITGQEVAVLAAGYHNAGIYEVEWDASGMASGIYFYHLNAGSVSMTKRMLFLE
jgi:hypothetical protein